MIRDVTVDLLRQAPLFARLPTATLGEVAANATMVSRRPGARIFEEGSLADSCYLLAAGRAKIVIAGADGTEVTIGFVQPYTLVGEIALIDAMPRTAAFIAVDDCRLVRIPANRFLQLRKHEEFNELLLVHVAATVRRATEQLRAIYTFDALERVAWCVAQIAAIKGRTVGREIAISPKPSHRELGEMSGSSRETVSRVLLRLRKNKWLRWDAANIYLDTRVFRRYFSSSPDHAQQTGESLPGV